MSAPPRNCRIRPAEPSWLARNPRRPDRTVVIDQVAIDEVLAGCASPSQLTPVERREAARQGIARGIGWADVAGRLHMSGVSMTMALAESLPMVDEPIAWWPTQEQLRLQPA